MENCCKNCKLYKELETWTYKDTANGQEVEHVSASGFACLAFVSEGTVVNLVGVNEEEESCEMFSRKPSLETISETIS